MALYVPALVLMFEPSSVFPFDHGDLRLLDASYVSKTDHTLGGKGLLMPTPAEWLLQLLLGGLTVLMELCSFSFYPQAILSFK